MQQVPIRSISFTAHEEEKFDVRGPIEPIHLAAAKGDVDAVQRLIEEDGRRLNAMVKGDGDVFVNFSCVEGWTALSVAAYLGRDAVVKRLLELGADTELRGDGNDGVTALYGACFSGRASTLALLLDGGASVNAQAEGDFDCGCTPLINAAGYGHRVREAAH